MGVQRMITLLFARPYTSAAKCDKPTRSRYQKMSGMRCHRCQRESPSGASFCWKCGARLAQSDPGGAAPQLNVSGGLTEIILTPQARWIYRTHDGRSRQNLLRHCTV